MKNVVIYFGRFCEMGSLSYNGMLYHSRKRVAQYFRGIGVHGAYLYVKVRYEVYLSY